MHTKRAKCAAKSGDGPVVTAPAPPQVIVRGLAEPGLLAHVIVSKYADHLPLNRLAKIFARDGLSLTVSTMVGWVRACAELLEPLVKLLGQTVLASHLLQTDDTGVQVLDKNEEDGSNESVAACEAADAAGSSDDAQTRTVLEIIATDERRHATMAWRALSWLLATHGDRVRAPLLARLAQLDANGMLPVDDFDARLSAFGRLSPSRHAEVRRRVVGELVLPLAHAMLAAPAQANATWPM